MLVILAPDDYDLWLDRQPGDRYELRRTLDPYPAALMKSHPVGRGVGDARREGPECATPMNITLPGAS